MKLFIIVAFMMFVQVASAEPNIGPLSIETEIVELQNVEGRVESYFNRHSISPKFSIKSVRPFRIFNSVGHLVCVQTEKNVLGFENPYAFMLKESSFYYAGGDYLCKLKSLSTGTEYAIKKAVAPKYTRAMKKENVKGHIVVQYTISKKGRTENVEVIHNSTGSESAVKSVIKAAKRNRYKPRLIAREPQEVHGVRQKYSF